MSELSDCSVSNNQTACPPAAGRAATLQSLQRCPAAGLSSGGMDEMNIVSRLSCPDAPSSKDCPARLDEISVHRDGLYRICCVLAGWMLSRLLDQPETDSSFLLGSVSTQPGAPESAQYSGMAACARRRRNMLSPCWSERRFKPKSDIQLACRTMSQACNKPGR